MVKSEQLKTKMKKATLITLSMGMGAGIMTPGMIPLNNKGAQVMEVHASDEPTLPQPNASFITDLGNVSHYNIINDRMIQSHNGKKWIANWMPNVVKDVAEFDGKLYATTSTTTGAGQIHRYNEDTEKWDAVGTAGTPVFDIIKTAKGNLVTGGGYVGTYGDYYSIYSSVGNDSTWAQRMNVYRSNSTGANPTGAGVFKTGVAVEGETLLFGTSMNWTNIRSMTDDVNSTFKQQIYGNYKKAIYKGGKVVAVGTQENGSTYGSIATANPGGSFTVTKLGVYNYLADVTYGNGKFVSVGSDMNGKALIYTSTDAVNWTKVTPPTGAVRLNAIAFDEANKRFVAVGDIGEMVVSIDGVNWVRINSGVGGILSGISIGEEKTAELAFTSTDGNVKVDVKSLVEGASSYEVQRDGEVVYTGSETSFVDTETLGATEYTYTVNVKDADGEVIGSKTKDFTTPNYSSVTAENLSGNVHLEMDYLKDEAVSYEVVRNGSSIYEGANDTFVDKAVRGATNYTYELIVKNADGVIVERKTTQILSSIQTPTNLEVEETSPTALHTTWGDAKNTDDTEYLVLATPKGVTPKAVTLVEDFNSATPVIQRTGNWYLISGMVRSASIGHNGKSASSFTIDVPTEISDAKLSFKYSVSSEAGRDFFKANLNGTQLVNEAGTSGLKTYEATLKPGRNILSVEYSKDGSTVRGADAAYLDQISVSYMDTGVVSSGWIKDKEFNFSNLSPDLDYDVTVVAKANGLQSDVVSSGSNPVEEATGALETATDAIAELNLTSPENIENAQEQLDAVQELVDALPEGDEKDALQGQLDNLQQVVTDAKELVEATEAVNEFIDALPEELTSREVIQEVKDDLAVVKELVESLTDSEAKTALEERLDTVQETIELAEQILDAVESVNELVEAVVSLDTPEAIQSAKDVLAEAKELVEALPEGDVKTDLTEQVAEAKEAIVLAEQILEAIESVNELVEAVVSLDTPEVIQSAKDVLAKAKELVEALPEGDVKTNLTEQVAVAEEAIKLAVAQDAVEAVVANPSQEGVDNALTLVNELKDGEAKTDLLATLEEVQQAIYLEKATELVEKAIETQTQEDADKAKDALALVKDEGSKAELEEDIQLVQDVIDAKPVQDRLRAFEAKLDTIDKRPKKDEASALQSEYQAIQDEISALRDGAVKEQLVSELATVKETLDAVLKNGNHPNKAPGQVKKDGVGFISKVLNFIFG